MSAELNPQPLPPGDRVRVSVHHDVSFNLEKMNRFTASVLGKLGWGGCHSERILEFVTRRDFVVNAKSLDVHEIAGPQVL